MTDLIELINVTFCPTLQILELVILNV